MYLVVAARPRDVGLAVGSSGAPTECRAGTKSPSSPIRSRAACAHPGHDPHVDDDVRRVGDLDAELGDRRAERAHRERDDVHRAAAHRAGEQALEGRRASRPGRASCWWGRRPPRAAAQMKVRSSTRATSLGSERARKRVRALGRGSSRMNVPPSTSCVGQPVPLLLRAVAPLDPVGLGQLGDLLHPLQQLLVRVGGLSRPGVTVIRPFLARRHAVRAG